METFLKFNRQEIPVSSNPLLEHDRIRIIDLVKGIDIIFMVLFNYSITFDYFDLIRIPSNYLYRFIFPATIASIFIFMSGISAYLSYEKQHDRFALKYFKRGVKLLFFAILITIFTYVFVPGNTIFFGILHFFAFASFFIPIFIKYKKLNLVAGFSIILSGIYLQQMTFDFSYLSWLGFVPKGLSTFDYFPLIPWMGVILLGIYYSRYFVKKAAGIRFNNGISHLFEFLGRNSLTVYLVHQPILILILIVFGFKLF